MVQAESVKLDWNSFVEMKESVVTAGILLTARKIGLEVMMFSTMCEDHLQVENCTTCLVHKDCLKLHALTILHKICINNDEEERNKLAGEMIASIVLI